MLKALALVNNKVLPIDEAKISIADNGYLLGDGVFETMRTKMDGRLFRPELHLARAQNGLNKLLINVDITNNFLEASEKLRIEAVKQIGDELYIRINISTGSGYNWSQKPNLNITGIAKPLPKKNTEALSCMTWNNFAEHHALSDVKSLSYARSALLRRKVSSIAEDEIILINSEGNVVEASISNVIVRKGRTVYAPGEESGALPGITRHILINELIDQEYQIEKALPLQTLLESDEVMLTSSISGVTKVSKINNSEYFSSELFDEFSQKYEKLIA